MVTDTSVHLFPAKQQKSYQQMRRRVLKAGILAPPPPADKAVNLCVERRIETCRPRRCLFISPDVFQEIYFVGNGTYGHDNEAPNVVSVPAGL